MSRHLDASHQPVVETTISNKYKFSRQSYQEIVQFVRQYKDEILQSSRTYNVSPEMIVAVLIDHNYVRVRSEDWKDMLGTSDLGRFFGLNPSLGPGQVNVGTAASLDQIAGREPKSRQELEAALQDPHTNIEYIAMTLSDLMKDLPNRKTANPLDDPSLAAKIGAQYRRGPSNADNGANLEGSIFVAILGSAEISKNFLEISLL